MSRREQWQEVLQTELSLWSGLSCDEVLKQLRARDNYEVAHESKRYQIEVVLLEDTAEYLHISVAVDDGSLLGSIHPESGTFICRKGQPLDGSDSQFGSAT